MTAVTTSYSSTPTHIQSRQRTLRTMLKGAAAFDASMGVVCLAAASQIGSWLSISTGTVRATGAVFLVAAVAGVETLLMPRLGVKWIVGANTVFALWCVAAIAFDSPGVVGLAILAASAAASTGTAVTEHWLGRAG
jgi:hypothetical protein